jgi:N-acyl-D-aspartate/D-glutamate deacylase
MSPEAKRIGRLQEGARADIVAFDTQAIRDRASFRAPTEASVGVRYLVVAGTLAVDNGRFVEGVAPGQPFMREH